MVLCSEYDPFIPAYLQIFGHCLQSNFVGLKKFTPYLKL